MPLDKEFWYKNWPRVGFIVGIYLLILQLFNSKYPIGDLNWWIWMTIPIYMFHQYEEYVFPGGFQKELNKILSKSESIEKITYKDTFFINITYIWVAGPLFIILGSISIIFTLIWMGLFVVNGIVHVIGTIKLKKYNPGLFFSVFFNIPLGFYILIQIYSTQLANTTAFTIGILLGVILHALLFIILINKSKRI